MNCATMKPLYAPSNKIEKRDIKTNKKYCGVCHKAGKPPSDYESHYTRSLPGPTGVITCPIILSAVCKSCGKSGHFSDHCKNISLQSKQLNKKIPPVKILPVKNNNLFSSLADYDDMPFPIKKKNTFKNTFNSVEDIKKEIRNLAPNGISFADMLLKPKPEPVKTTVADVVAAVASKKTDSNNNIEKILFAEKILSQPKRCSWLDSDSEEEDYCNNYDDDDSQSDW